jgi:hypothetical protein
MTTSHFEMAAWSVIYGVLTVSTILTVSRSFQRKYTTSIWGHFQRDSAPVRYWSVIAFFTLASAGFLYLALRNALKLGGFM